MVEPPYGIIWRGLKTGKVIPFLGAGASLVGREAKDKWQPDSPKFLPKGNELANMLADEASFPSSDPHDRSDLGKVSSYYVDVSTRSTLRSRLREVLNHDYQYGELHKFLASIPAPSVMVVTNYDTLLEQAFMDAGKPFDLVIYPADRKDNANSVLCRLHDQSDPIFMAPNDIDIDLDCTTVIYKMHGTIIRDTDKWDNFVITEEDYVEFLSRMTARTAIPSLFYDYFRERSFLFLGYSLRDWNLRVVLRNLSKFFASREENSQYEEDGMLQSWSIQHDPSELEKDLWRRRNVRIFDTQLDKFTAEMIKMYNQDFRG